MFIKNEDLVFVKSLNIKAFPCGRRRAELIDADNDNKLDGYIPFDPEARLNTEANNRRYSGLNGFKQSYLVNWNSRSVLFVIGGYLFRIDAAMDPATFGEKVAEHLGNNVDKIYANIRLVNVELFSGGGIGTVSTEVLCEQARTQNPSTCLDFPIENVAGNESATYKSDSNNYYFAGLSLSSKDLEAANEFEDSSSVISEQILEKDTNGHWQVYNPFRLPKIDHGDTRDSIKIEGDLTVKATDSNAGNISADGAISANGDITAQGSITSAKVLNTPAVKFTDTDDSFAVAMSAHKIEDEAGVRYQLQFYTPKA